MGKTAAKTCLAAIASMTVMSNCAAAEASDIPSALQDRIDASRADCAGFDSGAFALEDGAIQRVDLDGDGDDDWVLNENRYACSTAASLYGGTGGSMSHFLIDGEVKSILNQGWDIATFGSHTVLLAQVHGSNCEGINPTPCVTASVWDAEAKIWRSTGAIWE